MKEITLVFPDQIFENHPAVVEGREITLVEEFLYFKVQQFHKQRLVLLRAALQQYKGYLLEKGHKVSYVESTQLDQRKKVFDFLAKKGVKKIHMVEINDEWLEKDRAFSEKKYGFSFEFYPSPGFFLSKKDVEKKFSQEKSRGYFFSSFYIQQRKEMGVLMDKDLPLGGQFSFDSDNRKKMPKNQPVMQPYIPKENPFVKEAKKWVEKNFSDSIGTVNTFYYATNFKEAQACLDTFLLERFSLFGDFEDAIVKGENFLFHSVLSPLLNVGLLTPQQVLDKALKWGKKNKVPLNSLEGFVRQIIGWREFIRGMYLISGKKDRTANQLSHHRDIPKGFWDGTTGIEPIDETIKKVLESGYCHHIERLMVLGNFLLLCDTDPNKVYHWFMAYFVDAFDWVMVPNVYDMSQYANLGVITTKPYMSGSNYILKMSDYKKGDWVDLWDGLFWRFMKKHFNLLKKNPRLNMLFAYFKKNQKGLDEKILKAEHWLKKG